MELTTLPFLTSDLAKVGALQPDGWPNILPHFEFYCKADFCFPLKFEREGKLVGVGAAIVHGKTAWLAHIIVSVEHRNQGVGKIITQSLVDSLQNTECTTILLLATKLGEPVYRKIGFSIDSEYAFFNNGKPLPIATGQIIPFDKKFENSVLFLDRKISGENREKLLQPHLEKSHIIVENNNVVGCFFKTLGEGLILAENIEAGLTLLSQKHVFEINTILPVANVNGVNFLRQRGFQEFRRCTRMRLGKVLEWQPEKIYNRIGGNLG